MGRVKSEALERKEKKKKKKRKGYVKANYGHQRKPVPKTFRPPLHFRSSRQPLQI